jgi:hypothetical protein
VDGVIRNKRNLEQVRKLEYEVGWKGFEDCTLKLVESFEKGDIDALRNYLREKQEQMRIAIPSDSMLAVVIDK